MKKITIVLLACIMLFSGCVSNKEYEEMKIQYESQLLQKDEQISKLEDEYDALKNDAGVQLSRIREAFFLEDFERVVTLTEQLYEIHPNSNEYSEALDLYREAKMEINVKETIKKMEQEQQRKEKVRNIIRIYKSLISDVDSAGGVDIQIAWENTSDKTINYITFTVEVYNAVGDLISCEIKDKSQFNLKLTGPVHKGGGSIKSKAFEKGKTQLVDVFYGTDWENVLYNKTAKKIVIKSILIEYSDDSTTKLSGDDLEYAFY